MRQLSKRFSDAQALERLVSSQPASVQQRFREVATAVLDFVAATAAYRVVSGAVSGATQFIIRLVRPSDDNNPPPPSLPPGDR